MRDDQRICLQCGEMVQRRVAAGERLEAVPAGVPSWIAFEGKTSEPVALGASRIQRLIAAFIDAVILGVAGLALVALIGEGVAVSDEGPVSVDWARLAPMVAINALYFIVFPSTSWQGTPGKKLLGLRIVTLEHQPVSVFQSAARWVCQQVCFLVVFPLAAMVALFGIVAVPVAFLILMGNGRSPWDWMAGTMVVE